MKKVLLILAIAISLLGCSTDSNDDTITQTEEQTTGVNSLVAEVISVGKYQGSFDCHTGGHHTAKDYFELTESEGVYTLKMWEGYYNSDSIDFCYDYFEYTGTEIVEVNGYVEVLGAIRLTRWTHSVNGFNYICATYNGSAGDDCVSSHSYFNPSELTPCY